MNSRRRLIILLTIVWVTVAAWSMWSGLDYYRLSLQDRAYSELHDTFKPSGFVGHGLGIAGSLMMLVGVATYSMRKRMQRLQGLGRLRTWLTVHIFLCTLGPYLVLLHTAFRIGGLISIAFWSMVAVVLSGVFGRYVYTRIPKTAAGQFLSESAVRTRRDHMLKSLAAYHTIEEVALVEILRYETPRIEAASAIGRLFASLGQDVRGGRRRRRLKAAVAAVGVPEAEVDSVAHRLFEVQELDLQTSVSAPFKRLFGYWHVFHLPLATIMALIVLVHVAVAFTFGYFWIS